MHPPTNMTRIVDRTRYSVSKATLLTSDEYWDGSNWERHGRNTFLYRTPNGRYFVVTLTQWQGEQNTLEPVDLEEAIRLYEHELTEHQVTYAEAFPEVEVEEA